MAAAANVFAAGQRWVSTSEPELGLGTIEAADARCVTIRFAAADQTRRYAIDNAPIRRAAFTAGDAITLADGTVLTVTAVEAAGPILHYRTAPPDAREVPETELADTLSFHRPEDRIRAGDTDPPHLFDLRYDTRVRQYHLMHSPLRGLMGARVALIPHQLYVAHEVSARHAARVLLADEVGLGKTIEAGLILHRLLLEGAVDRALVIVPDSLVHQWFVEMLRRFNLRFRMATGAGGAGAVATDSDNPFASDQLVLCGLQALVASPRWQQWAVDARWDMLVVDEAHRLNWAPDRAGPAYRLVETLAARVPGVLLLSASPEQLGPESHFARLRILDPDRFHDLDAFLAEEQRYRTIADIVRKLETGAPLSAAETAAIDAFGQAGAAPHPRRLDAAARHRLIRHCIDVHGPSRVVFRNTRAAVSGFPGRTAAPALLPCPEPLRHRLAQTEPADPLAAPETLVADSADSWWPDDPRIPWLADLLRTHPETKFLLIANRCDTVRTLASRLEAHLNVPTSLFHQDLDLVAQDRSAAYFADPQGARLMLCSEIGSEGRNFQFCSHLVLFDLPANPDLLEQRIGRLDRIGQKYRVTIHLPVIRETGQEVLYRLYDAIGAFEHPVRGASRLCAELRPTVRHCAALLPADPEAARPRIAALTEAAQTRAGEIAQLLEAGRDRLVELNSCRPDVANQLVKTIAAADATDELEQFVLRMFEHFGVVTDDLGHHLRRLRPGSHMLCNTFPGLNQSRLRVTCHRPTALAHEDALFLSWEHPMVTGAIDLLLGAEHGNAGIAVLPEPGGRSLLLEAVFVLEAAAPPSTRIERFLPPTPVRVLIDHNRRDLTQAIPVEQLRERLRAPRHAGPLDSPQVTQQLLPSLVKAARETAAGHAEDRRRTARDQAATVLGAELERLRALRRQNPAIHDSEIDAMEARRQDLDRRIADAALRLDAVRLIWRGDLPVTHSR